MGIWRQHHDDPNKNILYESFRTIKQDILAIMGLAFGAIFISKTANSTDPSIVDSHMGSCVYDSDQAVLDVFSKLAKFNDAKVKERDESEKVDCSICANSVSPLQISYFSAVCVHKEMFCKDCIRNHVKAQVEGGNTKEIGCLGDGCTITATFQDVRVFFLFHFLIPFLFSSFFLQFCSPVDYVLDSDPFPIHSSTQFYSGTFP